MKSYRQEELDGPVTHEAAIKGSWRIIALKLRFKMNTNIDWHVSIQCRREIVVIGKANRLLRSRFMNE